MTMEVFLYLIISGHLILTLWTIQQDVYHIRQKVKSDERNWFTYTNESTQYFRNTSMATTLKETTRRTTAFHRDTGQVCSKVLNLTLLFLRHDLYGQMARIHPHHPKRTG